MNYSSTKIIELGSCAFRQWKASKGRKHAGLNSSRCSFVHGYRLVAKFWFEATELDERNWVVDFGGLTELKHMLKMQFDHTLCVAKDDPLLPIFQKLNEEGGCDLRIMDSVGIEKTAEWCFNTAQNYIKAITEGRCWVSKVEVWEHEANSAIYQPNLNNNIY
jgi:6-pyruvoyltetrahydropterin/6-carboxytetrahydropterin synthase